MYLVNGILVITFWGFVHPEGEQRNPMHWLSPASLPATPLAASTPLSPVDAAVTPAVTPVVDTVVRRRWSWRWLLWLLLALLLLALLLGLLRGCVPSLSIPGLPAITTDKTAIDTAPAIERPAVGVSDVTTQVSRTGSETVVGSAVVPGISEGTPVDAQQALEPTSPAVPAETTTAQVGDDAIPPAVPVSDANADASTTPAPPAVPGTADAQTPPAVQSATTPPVIPAQGTPLTLPPALPDGPAQFLNGEWRVNGGIQDKLTGRPLQLQYNFAQGNGTVSIRQSSGVTCRGPASGNVQQGALSITNPEQMKCSDGSNFIVPTIECKSPAAGHADCIGSNDGEKTFPIRMLQPNS